MPRIIQHQRLPYPGQVSIERLFAGIRAQFPSEFEVVEATSPFPSKGFWPRVRNVRHAALQFGDVHHIVGDAHYLAFGLPPSRLVLTIHDCAALNRLRGIRRAMLRFFWFSKPVRRAARVTTISETVKGELRQWIGSQAEKVRVIPNCVRSEFTSVPKQFNAEQPSVLQVGTGWNKNVVRVAEALRGTGCRLEIVGKLSADQRQKVSATGIHYHELGSLSDAELVEAYRRCDLVVFASLYEGFGLPIIEAQATGRPVITSSRSAMPEAAGDAALFVNPESVEAIRSAVLALVQRPELRRGLVERGLENVKRYKSPNVAAQYAALYRELLTQHSVQ